MKINEQIRSSTDRISEQRLKRIIYYLSKDPIPCRCLNYTTAGHEKNTLYEADEFICDQLRRSGYVPERESMPVQAFVPDESVPHGFRKPLPKEPWYEAFNLYAKKKGVLHPEELIVLIAHKDTQSWLGCAPGACDNAVGVSALLEMARIIQDVSLKRSVCFIFCNEEHWPWTSVTIAQKIAASDYKTIAVFNVDGIGGKSRESKSRGEMLNVTRYTSAEGEMIADLLIALNSIYEFGLKQSKYHCSEPNDDDGSFINSGIPTAVMAIGTYPLADPNYHTKNDIPEDVDIENVKLAAQLILCALLHIDINGLK